MNNLLTAIMTKISGSALESDVNGRIWLDEYQDDPPVIYPYIIYFDVTDNPDNVFAKTGEEYLFQFSLFSASKGLAEITTMLKDLKALFDDCSMTIPPTGTVTDRLEWCKRGAKQTMTEDITTVEGTTKVKHWSQEYEITTQKI
jgi:hypothetical protein